MTSRTGRTTTAGGARSSGGFTLIELIAVLAVLAAVMAISAPSLGRFFKHGSLQDEARRIVAFTRFARSEAISRGWPATVWFDSQLGSYGIRETSQASPGELDRFTHRVDESLEFDRDPRGAERTPLTITFLGDGSIDVSSLYSIVLREKKDPQRYTRIAQTYNRLRYEIRLEDDPAQDTRSGALTPRPSNGVYLR